MEEEIKEARPDEYAEIAKKVNKIKKFVKIRFRYGNTYEMLKKWTISKRYDNAARKHKWKAFFEPVD